ncbi:MAG: TAXI family TRAP transporter solute-binding subunit [Pseudomonadota bacterium]
MSARPSDTGDAANKRSGQSKAQRWFLVFALIVLTAGGGGFFWLDYRDREPTILTVATGPLGSDANILMREVADVIERHSDTLRLDVRASRDSSVNIARLNRGEIDVGVIRADTPVVSDVRVIADLYPDVFQLITLGSSRVFRVTDLQNATVSMPEFGTDSFRSFWVLGDHYDLPIGNFRWAAEPFEVGAARLLAGDVDVFFTVRSKRDSQLIRLFEDAQLTGLPLRIVPITQAPAIAIKRPFLQTSIIPQGTYTGATPVPAIDTMTPSVERILVSREDVDADAVRELTRVLFEHRLDLTIRFSLASAIQKPDETRGLSVPLHAGAAAFYNRDEPTFIQENAEPLALGVAVFTLLISFFLALRSRFTSSQKNRADTYNYQLLDIQKRAILEDELEELAGLKLELDDVLRTVVQALDTDDVTDEGFQSFSLLWEAVRGTINDRISYVNHIAV